MINNIRKKILMNRELFTRLLIDRISFTGIDVVVVICGSNRLEEFFLRLIPL